MADLKRDVRDLIGGISHPRSNISAVHFDGAALDDLLMLDGPERLWVEREKVKLAWAKRMREFPQSPGKSSDR